MTPPAAIRIGLNCSRLMPNYKGGINSFAFGLLDAFARDGRGHHFVIIAGPRNRGMFRRFEGLANFEILEIDGPLPRIGRGLFNRIPAPLRFRLSHRALSRWLNRGDARRIAKAVDVQYVPYAPMPIFPFPQIPTLYSIHDLQHVLYPQFFTAAERQERDIAFANTVAHAALMQASTRYMAGEFAAHFAALPMEKIVVIPEGVDISAFAEAPPSDVRARYGLPGRFLFYPAQLWPHKNHITIFRALARLKAQGVEIPLVLTGAPYAGSEALAPFLKPDTPNSIFHLGLVPYADIIALHRAARFLITASLYESSSIPILEACAAGTAVIASAIPSHAEQAEVLQMQLFPPTDDGALAELLKQAWNDDGLIARQTVHNSTAIKAFSWDRAAEQYLDAFESLYRQTGTSSPT